MIDAEMKRSLHQKKAIKALEMFEDDMMPTDNEIAEAFFFDYLAKSQQLGAILFNGIEKIGCKHRGDIEDHYNIVMDSTNAVGIVEVKYKAHENDLDKLDRKMHNFKKLYPIYQHYKQYGAIATFTINDDAKKEALRRGYFVLQRTGDVVHTESGERVTVL
jgi:hypothetical protein